MHHLEFSDEDVPILEALLAAGVCNIGAQIAQGGFAAIEGGRAEELLKLARRLREQLRQRAD